MIARRTNGRRRFPGRFFLVTVFCVTAEPLFAQTTIYVDANSTDPTHDGSSWCDAYEELYEALAALPPSGGTIMVAEGEYKPEPTGLTDPRDATFQLKNGVTILGGYAGCSETYPDERNVQQYESKLTGDLDGDDAPDGTASASTTCTSYGGSWSDDVCDSVDANGNRPTSQNACVAIGGTWYPAKCSIIRQDKRDDNVYHVLTADSTVLSAVLDGFTITGGNAQTRRCYDTNKDHRFHQIGMPGVRWGFS